MIIALARSVAREKTAYWAFFFLLLALPIQKKIKIFKGVATALTAPFHFPEAFQQNFYFFVTDLALVGFLALLSWRLLFRESSKYLLALFGIMLLSLLFSAAPVFHYVKLLSLFLFVSFFCALESGKIFKNLTVWFPKICMAVLLISLFECGVGILQYCLQKDLGLRFLGEMNNNCFVPFFNGPLSFFGGVHHEAMRRASGTFPHPNVFGGFMVFAIACSYFLLLWIKERREKIFLSVALGLQILTLALTFSRAALIAWFLMSLLFCFFCYRMERKWRAFALSLAVGFLAILTILYPAFKARGGVVSYNKVVKESDRERVQFQNIAWKMIQERPLLGVGFNQYVVHMQKFSAEPLRGDQFFPVHNIFLLIAAECGVLGLLCFLLFVGSILYRGFKRDANPVTATLLSLFTALLFIGGCDFYLLGSQHGKLIFFMVAGLLSLSSSEIKDVACR